MKWFLLPVVLFLHTAVLGQGTLKIFVALEDSRHDMDIIDLNTSAIDNYGVSVDSTNINFYTTTMSTQVVRLSREQLFGPELEAPLASEELILEDESPIVIAQNSEPQSVITTSLPPASTSERAVSDRSSTSTKSKVRVSNKAHKLKKTKRFKRYKGKCPKF